MTTHDPYLALAAAALDFGLTPAERTRLDTHLAGCPLCARSAAALRTDALVLAGLPSMTLPERRSSELLYAALHPARVRHPLRLVLVAALLALLALGSLAVGAEILRRLDDDRLVVLPPATATPAPDASAPSEPGSSPIPSGRLAVTRGDESGNGATWVEIVTLETGAAGPLGFGADPAWFRDGRLVYACAKALGENTTICMVDPAQELQPEIAGGATGPAPAPDGSLIAVHRGAIDVGETWLLRPDGQDLHRLTTGSFLHWSPDGAWLVGQPESATFEVAVIRADGSDGGPQVLAAGDDPAWSPAGDRIAYAVVDGQGAKVRVMTPFTDVSETRYTAPATSELSAPTWLPDGRLLFVLDGDLYRLDAGSSEPVRLTIGLTIPGDAIGDVLSVSPDGRWIAFTNGSGMDSRVGIASVDGGGWEMLELDAGPVSQPRWDPAPPGDPGTSPEPGQGSAGGPPGADWFEATAPVVEADRPVGTITAVTAGGPGFVAVGRGCTGEEPRCEAVVWTSADGTGWERAPVSEATTLTPAFPMSGPQIGMFDVAAGDPGIVATAPDGPVVLWASDDGSVWAAAEVEGGAVAPSPGAISEWHMASTEHLAVWLGPTRTEFDEASDPMAWVSDGSVP